jgi:nicotinate-nucleotide adenylyltransferase
MAVNQVGPIGIFGGTFDPIHFGHLRSAFEILQALRFSEVRLMPCGNPPHRNQPVAAPALRLKMVQVATEGQQGFVVDDRELQREGPSYSVDTLAALRAEFPLRPLALVIGMDAFLGLPKWYHWREILQLAHIVVAHRPGWRAPDMGPLGELLADRGTHRIGDLHDARSGHIYIHDVTQLEISSSEIRELVAVGRDPRFLLPDAVRAVIFESGCYADAAESAERRDAERE